MVNYTVESEIDAMDYLVRVSKALAGYIVRIEMDYSTKNSRYKGDEILSKIVEVLDSGKKNFSKYNFSYTTPELKSRTNSVATGVKYITIDIKFGLVRSDDNKKLALKCAKTVVKDIEALGEGIPAMQAIFYR
jgi:hypothetical protein